MSHWVTPVVTHTNNKTPGIYLNLLLQDFSEIKKPMLQNFGCWVDIKLQNFGLQHEYQSPFPSLTSGLISRKSRSCKWGTRRKFPWRYKINGASIPRSMECQGEKVPKEALTEILNVFIMTNNNSPKHVHYYYATLSCISITSLTFT